MKDGIFTRANVFISRWTVKPEKREEFISIFDPLWKNHIETMEQLSLIHI